MNEIYDYNVIKNILEPNGHTYYDSVYDKIITKKAKGYAGYNFAKQYNKETDITQNYIIFYKEPTIGMYKFEPFKGDYKSISKYDSFNSIGEVLFHDKKHLLNRTYRIKVPISFTLVEHREEPMCDIYAIT